MEHSPRHQVTQSQGYHKEASQKSSLSGIFLCHSEGLWDLLSSTVDNSDVLERLVAPVCLVLLNRSDDIHALDDLAKDDMSPIEPGGLLHSDEELRSICVLASIGHGQPACPIMLQLEVLNSKLFF